jgi:hypothetical protein
VTTGWERKKRDTNIMFAVTYDDGKTAYVTVSPSKLKNGDHEVRSVAAERQKTGELPPGNIASIKRVR